MIINHGYAIDENIIKKDDSTKLWSQYITSQHITVAMLDNVIVKGCVAVLDMFMMVVYVLCMTVYYNIYLYSICLWSVNRKVSSSIVKIFRYAYLNSMTLKIHRNKRL